MEDVGKALSRAFPTSFVFNGLWPLKMAMHPCIAEAVAFCDEELEKAIFRSGG